MKKTKKKVLLKLLMVSALLFMSSAMVFAGMNAFLVKTNDGRYYEYDKDALNYSYLTFQIKPDAPAAEMYKQFDSIGGGTNVIAIHDSIKGWMDYGALQTASLKAQITQVDFDVDTFIASPEALAYADPVTDVTIITPEGKGQDEVGVEYQCFVETLNWSQGYVSNGQAAGTSEQNLAVEALKIKLIDPPAGGKIEYRAYNDEFGWQDYVSEGEIAGTDMNGNNLEAIQIQLVNMPGYSVEYQVKIIGMEQLQGWVRDGEMAGTNGMRKPIESINIRIIKL